MTSFGAIILGIVQGATEFIPVSSSGHLIIVREILHINDSGGLAFDAVLQLATAFAVIIYFWRDIVDILKGANKSLFYALILGTLPAVVFGLLLEDTMNTVFRNVHLVAITLVLGAILLWFAQRKIGEKAISPKRGFVVGLFQSLALVPGISRSGATISGGLLAGLSKENALRFSFLLSIPVLLGSGVKKLIDIRQELFSTGLGVELFIGSVTAFIVGYFAIRFLVNYLKTHNFNVFIWYRIGLSIAIFLLF